MAEKTTKMTFADYAKQFAKDRKNTNILLQANLVPKYTRIKTLCPAVAYATWGGLPHKGRIFEVSGLNSSGKTSGISAMIADYLRNFPDKHVLYADIENTYDVYYHAAANGFDPSRVYLYRPDVGEPGEVVLGTLLDMANSISDISLIIIDSIPALVPSIDYENEFEKDNGMRGTLAKYLYKWQRELIPVIGANDIDVALINQTRIKGKTFTGADILDEPCGDAVKFYASVRIRFGHRKFVDENGEDLKNSTQAGKERNATTGQGASGYKIQFSFLKNKTAPTTRGGGYITYMFDETGKQAYMDITRDMFNVATKFGVINRLNNVTYEVLDPKTMQVLVDANGNELRGKKADLYNYFKSNREFTEQYTLALNERLASSGEFSGNLLDAETAAALQREDEGVTLTLKEMEELNKEDRIDVADADKE